MSAPQAPSDWREQWLPVMLWIGVSLAPLAALFLLLGSGSGPLRLAAVLGILSAVLIGLSVALRNDVEAVRGELEEVILDEVDAVRDDARRDMVAVAKKLHSRVQDEIAELSDQVEELRAHARVAARDVVADLGDEAAAYTGGVMRYTKPATGRGATGRATSRWADDGSRYAGSPYQPVRAAAAIEPGYGPRWSEAASASVEAERRAPVSTGSAGVGSASVSSPPAGSVPVGSASAGPVAADSRSAGAASVYSTSGGHAAVGSVSGSASVGSASVGSASVGSASVGSASVPSASVGESTVGPVSGGPIGSAGRRRAADDEPTHQDLGGWRHGQDEPTDDLVPRQYTALDEPTSLVGRRYGGATRSGRRRAAEPTPIAELEAGRADPWADLRGSTQPAEARFDSSRSSSTSATNEPGPLDPGWSGV